MDQGALKAAAAASSAQYRSFAEATRAVLDLLAAQLPDAAVFLAHLDRSHDIHRVVDARNARGFGLRANLAVPLSQSYCLHMADERAPKLCNDTAAHPVYGVLAAQRRLAAASYLGVPVELSDGQRVGSLAALSRLPGVFDDDQQQLFSMLARVLAYELERETNERDLRNLNDSIRAQARGLAAVARAARSLTGGGGDPRHAICEAAREAAEASVAFLLEPSGREFVSTAMAGIDLVPVTIQGSGDGRATQAFESLEPYFVPDARDHPALAKALVDATHARSALFEPVERDGSVAAVLILIWRDAIASVDQSTEDVMRLIAAQAAVAIEQSGMRERLGKLALTDDLTGLATRRSFDEELPREIARARRSEDPLCVAIVDLDHMSAFNMARGEREGDRLLKESASSWASTLREVDFFARVDGGEFGVILPGCMLGEAIEVLDRVRGLTPRGQTASAGVAMWNREEPAEVLAARARDALGAAKAAGRDMTIASD